MEKLENEYNRPHIVHETKLVIRGHDFMVRLR